MARSRVMVERAVDVFEGLAFLRCDVGQVEEREAGEAGVEKGEDVGWG